MSVLRGDPQSIQGKILGTNPLALGNIVFGNQPSRAFITNPVPLQVSVFTIWNLSASDGFNLTDTLSAILQMAGLASDGVNLTDAQSSILKMPASGSDGINLTDSPDDPETDTGGFGRCAAHGYRILYAEVQRHLERWRAVD